MDINAILEQQDKNWPNLQWHFFSEECENTFPGKQFFYESMWASWLSKINDGEKHDEAYFTQRLKDAEEFIASEEGKDSGDAIGDILNDEYYENHIVHNNIYSALVVSIWSKCELTLNRLSRLCTDQLKCNPPKGFQYDNQKAFFKDELGIKFSSLQSNPEVNAIRILNNIYKHQDGYCNKTNFNKITKGIATRWKIELDRKVDYTILPIQDFLEHCHTFFEQLCANSKKIVDEKRPSV